jgi:hypothetical protein
MMQLHIREDQNPQIKEILYSSQGIMEAEILSILLTFAGNGVER